MKHKMILQSAAVSVFLKHKHYLVDFHWLTHLNSNYFCTFLRKMKVSSSSTEGAVSMIPSFSLLLAGFLLLDLASAEVPDGSVESLANGNVDFAVRLYQAVASRTDDNVCLSTFALSSVLSVLLSATSGPTREQLSQGLGLSGLDPQTPPGMMGFWAELFSPKLCSDNYSIQICSRI